MRPPLAAGLFVLLAACGSGDGGADDAQEVVVSVAWARTSAPGQTVGAVYFQIESGNDDKLMAVSVPDSVAAGVEIHETVVDQVSVGASTVPGMQQMSMREVVGGVALPAGQKVSFESGGYHVMLVDLAQPLVAGERFDITLDLEHGSSPVVTVEIAETQP